MDISGNSDPHIWEKVCVEIEGPFKETCMGNQYVIILTDSYSRWIEAKAVSQKTAPSIAGFVMSTFSRMGFADCEFLNLEPSFEYSVRMAIHSQGSTFVRRVEKFRSILEKIWNEEMEKPAERIELGDGGVFYDVDNVEANVAAICNSEFITGQECLSLETPKQKGHHTLTMLNWIEQNPETWDSELEEYVFKLRMDDIISVDGVECLSPFAIMYGRSNIQASETMILSDTPSAPPKKTTWNRGRGRGRGRWRGRGRGSKRISNSVAEPKGNLAEMGVEVVQSEVEVSTSDTQVELFEDPRTVEGEEDSIGIEKSIEPLDESAFIVAIRPRRGRPRKSLMPVRCVLNEECAATELEVKEASEPGPSSEKKYGLRTTLKAKVKTNIVQRMLRLSTRKRASDNGMEPPTFLSKKMKATVANKGSAAKLDITLTPGEGPNQGVVLGITEVNDDGTVVISGQLEDESFEETATDYDLMNLINTGTGPQAKLARGKLGSTNARLLQLKSGTALTDIGDGNFISEVDDDDDDEDFDKDDISEDMGDDLDKLDDDDDIEQDEDEDQEGEPGEDCENGAGKEKIPCNSCPGLLLTQQELSIHSSFHKDGSKLLHCLYCTHVTGTWDHMQDHLMGHIENNTAPGAATMLKKLRGSRAAAVACRKLRRRELAGSLPLRCSLCVNVRMATEIEQQVHHSCHREDSRLLRCPHCSLVRGNWVQMQNHLASHPEVPQEAYSIPIEEKTCPRCHKVFPSAETVLQHQLVFHARDRRFICEVCGKTFKERKSILRHQELHANIIYQCGDCSYKTRIQRDFVAHQGIHQGKGYCCGICQKVFARQAQLTLHQECHRKDRGIAICDQCGHKANGMAALRHHVRNVHGVAQSWPCAQCSYVGKTKSNLKGHTDRIHNKKFKCSHCDFACLAECTLIKHIDIFHNEGERRYPCPHCPYRAREPKCLTEHVRVLHNPYAVKFPCEFCGVEFKTKSMLRDHMPQHTGQRFICQLCGYVAKYRSILYRHVKKRHPGHILSSVMKNTEPLVTETPDGKPILPPKSRAPRRRYVEVQQDSETATMLLDGSVIEADGTMTFVASEMADGTTAYIEASGEEESGMFLAATADGETLTVDQNSIVLDASLLAQAAAGGHITLPNNLCLQIIHKDEEGENITMQVIPAHSVGEGDEDKAVELLLLAGDDMEEVQMTEEEEIEGSNIIVE